MKQLARFAFCIALLAVAFGPSFAGDGDVTLTGNFVWTRTDGDSTGDLKAVFTPTGKKEWDVAFHFDWEDGPHFWAGTAQGSLKKGALKGEVQTDNEERKGTFRFNGKFKGGKFTGKHHSVRDGKEQEMGSLTLSAG